MVENRNGFLHYIYTQYIFNMLFYLFLCNKNTNKAFTYC